MEFVSVAVSAAYTYVTDVHNALHAIYILQNSISTEFLEVPQLQRLTLQTASAAQQTAPDVTRTSFNPCLTQFTGRLLQPGLPGSNLPKAELA